MRPPTQEVNMSRANPRTSSFGDFDVVAGPSPAPFSPPKPVEPAAPDAGPRPAAPASENRTASPQRE
jgi:hypothetical protein